jgi:hypothetical protein
MDAKDKIDACLKLAEMGAARWKNRQTYEWKVTLLIWAGLLAGAKFMREAEVAVPTRPLIAGGVAFLALYAFLWLRGVWTGNYNDKAWDIFYRKAAAELISTDSNTVARPPAREEPPLRKFLVDYSPLFQILMTALIVAAAIAVIASTPLGTDQKNRKGVPANGSQPIRLETNGMPSATGFRR